MMIGQLSAMELGRAIADGRLSSAEVLEYHVARMERHNPAVNAVVATDCESAAQRAAEADASASRGESWGPLHGVPMTVKDSIEVVGMPATAGAPEWADHFPATTAPSVERLIDAGAIVFGKTNLPIYAGDLQTYNAVHGTTANPWDLERSPGGSSGGSAAALAAGITPLELGSDIGGSIRNPAHYCGVYGHKPSHGIVPMRGHLPGPPGTLSTPDIAVMGPLARTAPDLDMALGLITGPDSWEATAWRFELPEPRHARITDFRVAAWLDDPLCPVDTAVGDPLDAAVRALERAGVAVDRMARPAFDPAASRSLFLRLMYGVMGPGFPRHVAAAFDAAEPGLTPVDTSLAAEMARGIAQRHRTWLSTNERRQRLRAAWAAFFEDFDVLLCPVMPTTAIEHDHSDVSARTVAINGEPYPYLDQVFWAGLTGGALLPATSAPVGLSPGGLPVGIQIAGPYLEDRTPIAFAGLMADVVGGFEAPSGYVP